MEYEAIFRNQNPIVALNVLENTTIQEYFCAQAEKKFYEVNTWYLAGMSMNNISEIIAWFNYKSQDPSAVSLNLVHNAMIKAMLGDDHSIRVIDFPLPIREYTNIDYKRFHNILHIEPMILILSIAISITSSFYIIFYIRERAVKVKLLQISSGLNIWIYWMTSFLFDFATYLVTVFVTILILLVCQKENWSTAEDLAPVHVVLFSFGFSMLPMTYLLSLIFSNTLIGFTCMAAFTVSTSKKFVYNLKYFSNFENKIFSYFHRHFFRNCNATNKR